VKVLDMNIKVFPSLNLLGYTSIKSVIFSSLHGGVKDGRGCDLASKLISVGNSLFQ
jgi:hypothetical protein